MKLLLICSSIYLNYNLKMPIDVGSMHVQNKRTERGMNFKADVFLNQKGEITEAFMYAERSGGLDKQTFSSSLSCEVKDMKDVSN